MKLLIADHNSVLMDLENHFEVAGFDYCDLIIMWNDVLPVERSMIDYARKKGKPVWVAQHGRRGSSRYHPPFNEKIYADKMLVWGEADKERMIKSGQDPNKIIVAGTTIFSHLKPRLKHEGKNIVFCPEHWDRPVDENIKVRDELRKLKGYNIITKIIESHNPDDFDNPIQTNRDSNEHLDKCIEVLQTADLVVGVAEGTFELLAQAMDIPVVIVKDWEPKSFGGDMRYLNYERIISDASQAVELKDLAFAIDVHINNPQLKAEERKNIVIKEGGLGIDIVKTIESLWMN